VPNNRKSSPEPSSSRRQQIVYTPGLPPVVLSTNRAEAALQNSSLVNCNRIRHYAVVITILMIQKTRMVML